MTGRQTNDVDCNESDSANELVESMWDRSNIGSLRAEASYNGWAIYTISAVYYKGQMVQSPRVRGMSAARFVMGWFE